MKIQLQNVAAHVEKRGSLEHGYEASEDSRRCIDERAYLKGGWVTLFDEIIIILKVGTGLRQQGSVSTTSTQRRLALALFILASWRSLSEPWVC